MRYIFVFTAIFMALTGIGLQRAAYADDFVEQLEKARTFYGQGNLLRVNASLQQALNIVQDRLGESLGKAVPPPPPGWEANDIETEGLNDLGGGIRVGRSYYRQDGATLGVQIYVDSAPVQEAVSVLADLETAQTQPGVSVVSVDGENALLRWDQTAKSGEIQLVIGGRALVYVEADQIDSGDLLVSLLRQFDLGLIRSQLEL